MISTDNFVLLIPLTTPAISDFIASSKRPVWASEVVDNKPWLGRGCNVGDIPSIAICVLFGDTVTV